MLALGRRRHVGLRRLAASAAMACSMSGVLAQPASASVSAAPRRRLRQAAADVALALMLSRDDFDLLGSVGLDDRAARGGR